MTAVGAEDVVSFLSHYDIHRSEFGVQAGRLTQCPSVVLSSSVSSCQLVRPSHRNAYTFPTLLSSPAPSHSTIPPTYFPLPLHPPFPSLDLPPPPVSSRQLAWSIHEMHERGIIHRDIKPENVLLVKPPPLLLAPGAPVPPIRVKLADFGLAVYLGPGQAARGVAGSPFYMAPEVIRNKAYHRKVDVWSLGVVLYTCLSGEIGQWVILMLICVPCAFSAVTFLSCKPPRVLHGFLRSCC